MGKFSNGFGMCALLIKECGHMVSVRFPDIKQKSKQGAQNDKYLREDIRGA